MNHKNQTVIITGLIAAIISGTFVYISQIETGPTHTSTGQTQNTEGLTVIVSSSYTSDDVSELKNTAKTIIKGKIIDKYQIVQYRDEFGSLVEPRSKMAVAKDPYIVYDVQVEKTLRGEDAGKSLKVKLRGGTFEGMKVEAGFDEYNLGDTIVILADGPFDQEYYQPMAGPHSIFKIQNGQAIGAEKSMSEASLLEKLQ